MVNENETKVNPEQPAEVHYDASGKRIMTSPRNKELENAILSMNDKMDQLIGILTSTLPTRISSELRGTALGEASGGEGLGRVVEILSGELPERLKKDADENVFQKAEMLSVVFSTSIQHLQDAFKSYQDSLLKAIEELTRTQEKSNQALTEIHKNLKQIQGTGIKPVATEPTGEPATKTEPTTDSPFKPTETPSATRSFLTPEEKEQKAPETSSATEPSQPEQTASSSSKTDEPTDESKKSLENEASKEETETPPKWLQSEQSEGKSFGWPFTKQDDASSSESSSPPSGTS